MPTSTRQYKRRFQPSITSYFARADRDFNLPIALSSADALSPPLPTAIQSSLLNVGMRVRKAVPEGYKTTSKHHTPIERPRSAPAFPAPRGFAELAPYCGIMKIGGHSSQPAPAEEDLPPLQSDNDNDGFPSSQESMASTISTESIPAQMSYVSTPAVVNKNKRRCDVLDRDDSPDSAIGDDHFAFRAVFPRTYPVSHTRMPNLDSTRPISIPKTRNRWIVPPRTRQSGEAQMVDIGDFEEAEFFKPDDWATTEVEMGGL